MWADTEPGGEGGLQVCRKQHSASVCLPGELVHSALGACTVCSGACAHTEGHSFHILSYVKRETRSGDPGQHRNANVPEGGSCFLVLLGF